jgi:hypothetical protein
MTMMSKIADRHLSRQACIYIRQSTLAQVRSNQESTDRQYNLLIGIGGRLATPPLPHHQAYGSVPWRFESLANTHRTRTGGRAI